MRDDWQEWADDTAPPSDGSDVPEYVHAQLPDGEPVRFKRTFAGHRFTDAEVAWLLAGADIVITTSYAKGVIGSLEWQTYNGYEYYGFAPWDAEAYTATDAPFPHEWNGCTFDAHDEAVLRSGARLLVVATGRTGQPYGVNVTFEVVASPTGETRWAIVPHFDEFDQPPEAFTRETAPFLPVFSGRRFTTEEVERLRRGAGIPFTGVSRSTGRRYTCRVYLRLERRHGVLKWALVPVF